MNNPYIHKNFKLNGISFNSVEELVLFSKKLSASTQQFLQEWFSNDDSIVVQTSGSTGNPKSISIKKEFMVNSALATGVFLNLSEKITALLCLPTNYIAGKMMLVRALVLGWKIDVITPNSRPLYGIKKTYDFTAMIPLQLYNSIDDLHKIKKLIVGGGLVSSQLQEKIQNVSTQVFVTYGMTETVTHIAMKRLQNSKFKIKNYKLLPNIKISKDQRNCLVIDAPKIASERIITNDVIKIISETEFEWLGRFDNVINSGGIKLHPEQIEEKLSKIILQRFFVVGVSDEILGEKLVLIIELKNRTVKSIIKSKINKLRTLTKYEIPKKIYFVPNFIETDTKKIQRKKTLNLVL